MLPNPPSGAAEHFKNIITSPDPFAFLVALVGSIPPTTEEDWLEFTGGVMSDDDLKKKWSS